MSVKQVLNPQFDIYKSSEEQRMSYLYSPSIIITKEVQTKKRYNDNELPFSKYIQLKNSRENNHEVVVPKLIILLPLLQYPRLEGDCCYYKGIVFCPKRVFVS
jgi:hypothetical protein